jgi:hypothetical protein
MDAGNPAPGSSSTAAGHAVPAPSSVLAAAEAPASPHPQDRPEAPPIEAPAVTGTHASAQEAWNAWLDAGATVPKGFAAFLRTADVRDLEDGRVSIGGLAEPAAERLAEPAVMEAVREGLAPYLGRAPRLVVGAPSTGPEALRRVTEEEVRDDTLKALYRQEPRLQRAVEELDLELMD